jgi:hypothetical protein
MNQVVEGGIGFPQRLGGGWWRLREKVEFIFRSLTVFPGFPRTGTGLVYQTSSPNALEATESVCRALYCLYS